jgi:hypothetical protein
MKSDQINVPVELTEEQLGVVCGGDKKAPRPPPTHDLQFTKVVDKSSAFM